MTASNDTSKNDLRETFGVYQIRNLATGMVYVGSTTQTFWHRRGQHLSLLEKKKHDNSRLQNSWSCWGAEFFVFEVLEVVSDKSFVIKREQEIIDQLKTRGVELYNQAVVVSNPMQNRKHTAATKEKIRIKAIGRKRDGSWNKGIPTPIEVREKISQSSKGRAIPPDQLKLRFGKKRTPETRARMLASALKGKDNPASRPENRAKISASILARHFGDRLVNELPILELLDRRENIYAKDVLELTSIPDGSLWRMLRKLVRLGYVVRVSGKRYFRYSITQSGKSAIGKKEKT